MRSGSKVEYADLIRRWHPAVLGSYDGDGWWYVHDDEDTFKVRTEDIRTPPIDPASLTLGSSFGYNTHMNGPIVIPDLGVTIPETSAAYKIEKELEPYTAEMNRTPLMVNKDTWFRNQMAVAKEVLDLSRKCQAECGDPKFRPNASADCARVFQARGIRLTRTTKSGAFQLDMPVLEELQATGDPLIGMVIEARHRISTLSQLNKWSEYVQAGVVQCTWNQYGSPAARYTSEGPSLQNRVVEIRETIEAPPGYDLLSADLGQAEYVTWASLSEDSVLAEAFLMKVDFHLRMATSILKEVPTINLHGETPRQFGKTLNFAMLYRMKVATLAKKLGCTYEIANQIYQAYCRRAPRGMKYIEEVLQQAHATSIVSTYFGRERLLPELRTARSYQMAEVEKTAWHHHNSGTAAEILKIKTVRLMNKVRQAGLGFEKVRIGLNMHDEVILIVRKDLTASVSEMVTETFQESIENFIPYAVDMRVGPNWLSVSK